MFDKERIVEALTLPEFRDWESPPMKGQLNRPRRRPVNLPGNGRVGAVMLLLFRPDQDESLHLALTRRQPELNYHGGQISLPGGRQDEGESLVQTALRETREEIGIDDEQVEILGQLSSLYIPPSDFTIHPYVGWFSGLPSFKISEVEVAEIIEAKIEDLASPTALQYGPILTDDRRLLTSYYPISGFKVWGATAIVINEFIERIRAAG